MMPNPVPWLSPRPTLPVGPLHLEGPYARLVRVCADRCCVAGRCGLPDVTQGVACCSSDDCRGRVGAGHGAQSPAPGQPGGGCAGGHPPELGTRAGSSPASAFGAPSSPRPSCPWGLGKGRVSGVHISAPLCKPRCGWTGATVSALGSVRVVPEWASRHCEGGDPKLRVERGSLGLPCWRCCFQNLPWDP